MEESSIIKEESIIENKNENKIEFPPKKYLNLNSDDNGFWSLPQILTNLTALQLNPNAIKDVYLYGCDIEEENHISDEFNPVHLMRTARKMKCFQDLKTRRPRRDPHKVDCDRFLCIIYSMIKIFFIIKRIKFMINFKIIII